ncbi:uncharacterized protein F4812DRAFT_417593 [Daldinia caldariorum]|uniref:uncharacterized protein n=1 Tax=Daldinia caldariorum TaxID=326644 RepID=UPI002008C2F9|nr:uncharacterized protein F4812DRAFT_417593 [Daldinia caldariorum]KAI1470439.1 hypothetical protein F4812DRAFT_417593 [Daldinia caldariorum]
MAQASIAREPIALGYQPGAQNGALSSADLDEISQYQKVINFRDTIVSGKHPRIKVAKPITPQHSASLARDRVTTSSSALPLQNAPNLNSFQVDNMQSFKTNLLQPAVAVASTGSNAFIPGVSRPLDSARVDTNSLSQQAVDYIAKAELQMQRLKIEQELKEEFENRKALAKTPLQPSEQPADLDLSDILAKALTLVQATAPPPSSNTLNGGIVSDSSDSFDDNTFYSSPFETPDSRASPLASPFASPRVQNPIRQDVQMQDTSATTSQQTQFAPQPAHPPASSSYQTDINRSTQPIQTASSSRPPQPNASSLATSMQERAAYNSSKTSREGDMMVHTHQARQVDAQVISSDSGAASRSDNSGNTDSDQPADFGRIQNPHQLLPSAHFRQQASPVVRAHDLSPFAPQPAHVSPLAVARRPPIPEPEISILSGAPAQVTALRQEHTVVVTSPESSPQGEKGGKKKNKKKNKRKAETRAPDAPGSPYIKPEPRSPSPLSAPQLVRPQKRPRPDARPGQEPVYDELRIERPVSVLHRDQYPAPVTHVPAERPPYGFERVDDPSARQLRQSVAPASQRLDRGVYEERRPDGTIVQYIQRVQSPYGYPPPYAAVESRSLRSASYSVNPPYRDVPTYQRDGRMSVRPYADRARSRSPVVVERRSPTMAPPAPPPRVLVDQYGREYFDPPRPSAVTRHSVVPPPRSSEREVIYERVPLRAPSRMAGETFEEDGIIYRRASPTFASRRVITQPEYGVDYRSHRERDYSIQPMGAPNQEYVSARGVPAGRGLDEISRDYLPRATSVRPPEAVPYYNRVEAVRPEVPSRRYAASVHPEVRRDVASAVVREFGARPVERDLPRREFSIQPVERYYDRPPHQEEEVTYIERPRAAQQEIIYADNSRRQVYQ